MRHNHLPQSEPKLPSTSRSTKQHSTDQIEHAPVPLPRKPLPAHLDLLQRTVGNHATSRLLRHTHGTVARAIDPKTSRGIKSFYDLLGGGDWAGRMILAQYLRGDGEAIEIFDDPRWTAYMEASLKLRRQNYVRVIGLAQELARQGKEGRLGVRDQYHAEFENGESMIGYQFLHGTNSLVGDFEIIGFADVKRVDSSTPMLVPGKNPFVPQKHPAGFTIDFELTYIWNDIIDPNSAYWSDQIKAEWVNLYTWGGAQGYDLFIHWRANCSVFIGDGDQGQWLTGGYPRL